MIGSVNLLKNFIQRWKNLSGLFQKNSLIELCFYLEQFLKAGWSLHSSLKEVVILLPALKMPLTYCIQSIEKGQSFSRVLEKFPLLFSHFFCSYIRLYEKLGNLSEGFKELGLYLKWKKDFNHQLFQALLYPCLSLAVLGGAGGILYTFFIPEFLVFLDHMDQEIPKFTQVVLTILKNLGKISQIILTVGIFLGISFKTLMHFNESFHILGHKIIYKVPYIGRIKHKQDLIHFFKIIDAFYRQTGDIIRAMKTAVSDLENTYFRFVVNKIIENLLAGKTFASAIEVENFMPSLIVKILKTGEKTNHLSASIQMIFYLYEQAIRQEKFLLLTFLQPCLLLISGGILASLLYAVFAPLYTVMGTVML